MDELKRAVYLRWGWANSASFYSPVVLNSKSSNCTFKVFSHARDVLPFHGDIKLDGPRLTNTSTKECTITWTAKEGPPSCVTHPFSQEIVCQLEDKNHKVVYDFGTHLYWRVTQTCTGCQARYSCTVDRNHVVVCPSSDGMSQLGQDGVVMRMVRKKGLPVGIVPVYCDFSV